MMEKVRRWCGAWDGVMWWLGVGLVICPFGFGNFNRFGSVLNDGGGLLAVPQDLQWWLDRLEPTLALSFYPSPTSNPIIITCLPTFFIMDHLLFLSCIILLLPSLALISCSFTPFTHLWFYMGLWLIFYSHYLFGSHFYLSEAQRPKPQCKCWNGVIFTSLSACGSIGFS